MCSQTVFSTCGKSPKYHSFLRNAACHVGAPLWMYLSFFLHTYKHCKDQIILKVLSSTSRILVVFSSTKFSCLEMWFSNHWLIDMSAFKNRIAKFEDSRNSWLPSYSNASSSVKTQIREFRGGTNFVVHGLQYFSENQKLLCVLNILLDFLDGVRRKLTHRLWGCSQLAGFGCYG